MENRQTNGLNPEGLTDQREVKANKQIAQGNALGIIGTVVKSP